MMRKKKITCSLEPQNVSDSVWYYEEGRHISVVVRTWDFKPSQIVDGGTIQFDIPLQMLERSLMRMPRKKRIALKAGEP
jgi:hypothetical protein